MTPWVGWYAAIEDILHTLPESKFAPWQIARLNPDLFESTLITNSGNQPNGHADRQPVQCDKQTPCPPVTTQFNGRVRAFLCGVQGEGGDLYRDGVPPSRYKSPPSPWTPHRKARTRPLNCVVTGGQGVHSSHCTG